MTESFALCGCTCCAEKTSNQKDKEINSLKDGSTNSVFDVSDAKSEISCSCVDNYKKSLKNNKEKISQDDGKHKKGFLIKALTSIAGLFLLGSGQAINGDWTKAAIFALLMPVLTKFIKINPAVKTTLQKMLKFIACFDAYKNA